MARWSCLVVLLLPVVLAVVSGCSEAPAGKPHTHNPAAEVTICGLCGELKGSEKCCKAGVAAECQICGLHKGSILCCSPAISGRRDRILCRKCGEVAHSMKCCQPGPVLCQKCGLHKGSPGCCKIEKYTGDAEAPEANHE